MSRLDPIDSDKHYWHRHSRECLPPTRRYMCSLPVVFMSYIFAPGWASAEARKVLGPAAQTVM
jgi:hypothetical protein